MFSPIKNTKVYELVFEQIKHMIVNGTLKRGDKLPSERELVEQLQVSRTSIREALRALQIIGLIECRHGEGNFIREKFENSLFEPLSIMFMLHESTPKDIIEVRMIIELEAVAAAANKITDEELASLAILVKNFKDSQSEDENVEIDKKFHYEIARASGNFLLFNILNVISELIDSFIDDARRKIIINEKNIELLAKQHEDIYEALQRRNPQEAIAAMKRHLDIADEYMLK